MALELGGTMLDDALRGREAEGNTGRSASKGIPHAANAVRPNVEGALRSRDAMFPTSAYSLPWRQHAQFDR